MKRISLRTEFAGLDREAKIRRYRELWHLSSRQKVLPDYPLHLDLELSGICNLACTNCFQEALNKKELGLMEPALFKRLVDEGVENGLCAIKLQIRGESFLHPEILPLTQYAKEQGVLDVQVTTNATRIKEKDIDDILDSGLDGIIFSVDVRHADACSDCIAAPEYDHVTTIVNALLDKRKERGLSRPWVRLKASTEDPSPEVQLALKEELVRNFPLADIHIVGTIFDFRKDHDSYPSLQENYNLDPCVMPWQRMAVFWDGQTTVCCMDYHADFGFPNVRDTSIADIWNSPRMERLRQGHLNGDRHKMPICRHCHLYVSPANDKVFLDDTRRNLLDREIEAATTKGE